MGVARDTNRKARCRVRVTAILRPFAEGLWLQDLRMAGRGELRELCPRQECKGTGAEEFQPAREQEDCCQSGVERDLGEFRKRQELGYVEHLQPWPDLGLCSENREDTDGLGRSE